MHYRFHIVEKTVCHQGFFRLDRYRLQHDLFAGGTSPVITRELLERGRAAAVLPYDPVRDSVVMIEQFRIGAIRSEHGAWLLEFVAGIIEDGEKPEDVVRREALEEAGCELGELVPVARYLPSPGGSTEELYLYCGRVDAGGAGGIHGLDEEAEDIRVHVYSFDKAMDLLERGRIDSAAPIIALQWLALHRERLRRRWLAAGG